MNFHTNKNKGFTLLELLVVITLIGIFALISVAALGSSRKKGSDASLKSTLAGMRAQGELYYSNNARSYGTGVTVPIQVNATRPQRQTYSVPRLLVLSKVQL